MSETDLIEVGELLPRIRSVAPQGGTTIAVSWAETAAQDVVDLAPLLYSYKVYRPLRDDPALFGTVREADDGSRLVWGPDDQIDLPADSVWELARQQMSAADFGAFVKSSGRTLDATAAQLGISRRLAAYYAAGDRPIPRYIALACAQLETLAKREARAREAAQAA